MKIAKIKTGSFKFMGATFYIQELRNGDIAEINEAAYPKTMEMREVDGKITPIRAMGSNSALDTFLTFQRSTTGWDEVKNEENKPIECDDSGKEYFYKTLPKDIWDKFYKKFKESYDALTEAKKEQKAEQEKN